MQIMMAKWVICGAWLAVAQQQKPAYRRRKREQTQATSAQQQQDQHPIWQK
jgi:hypothetical protein